MPNSPIQVPEKGTYQRQLFEYWSRDYHLTQADHSAYIALNFAGVLDDCKNKLLNLMQYHHQQKASGVKNADFHERTIQRLQGTMTAAALAYECGFKQMQTLVC